MRITILCVGKIKEKFYSAAVDEYKKRLSRYCRLDIVEVADEKTEEGASPVQEEQVREKEGERLLKQMKDDAYTVTLEIRGEMPDSVQLAEKIEQLGVRGVSHIQFVIGGPWGCPGLSWPGGLSPEFFEDGLSPSAYAGDPAGADLPVISHYKGEPYHK